MLVSCASRVFFGCAYVLFKPLWGCEHSSGCAKNKASFGLQVAAVLGAANSLSASAFPALTLSLDQWLSTSLACRDTAESGHLYWPRGRERGRFGDCSVVERYSRACVAIQGRIVWKPFFFFPLICYLMTQMALLWRCSACFCLLSSPPAVSQKLSACGALISGGL